MLSNPHLMRHIADACEAGTTGATSSWRVRGASAGLRSGMRRVC